MVAFGSWLLLAGWPLSALSQNSNPTGAAGRFNALSTTADPYDPYTMNATRTIPELAPAGSVGMA